MVQIHLQLITQFFAATATGEAFLSAFCIASNMLQMDANIASGDFVAST